MCHRLSAALVALVLIAAGPAVAWALVYHVTDLVPLGSDPTSYAYGMGSFNGAPAVFGRSLTSGNVNIPVVWTGGTPNSLLSYIPGASDGIARWAASGGGAAGSATVNGSTCAFYLPGGSSTATILPVLNNSNAYGAAFGVNNAGQVVGYSTSTDASNYYHAFVWSSTAGIADLSGFAGAAPGTGYSTISNAQAINDNGQVVGNACKADGTYDPAMWTYNGSAWTITNLNPTHAVLKGGGAAFAVNQYGDAVGTGTTYLSGIVQDAYLFKHDGTVVNLGGLVTDQMSSRLSYARAVNAGSTVVGYSTTNGGGYHAFVWTSAGGVQDLNGLVAADGSGTGWTLQRAWGIDDAGNIIGYGTVASGATHAFLLTPAAQFPGDTNGDGVVDVADLNRLLTNYNKTGMTWSQGDFSGDGSVDVSDLNKLLTNYNKTGVAAGAAPVPEPSSLAILAAGILGLAVGAARKRRQP